MYVLMYCIPQYNNSDSTPHKGERLPYIYTIIHYTVLWDKNLTIRSDHKVLGVPNLQVISKGG